MATARLTIITQNQKTKEKANMLSELIQSSIGVACLTEVDKYYKYDDSFIITVLFACDSSKNLVNQLIKFADKLLSPWLTYYDNTTNTVDLIYNKTSSSRVKRVEFNVIQWAELQLEE